MKYDELIKCVLCAFTGSPETLHLYGERLPRAASVGTRTQPNTVTGP